MDVELLYWGRSWGSSKPAGGKVQFEYHAYCQLEVCVHGKMPIVVPDKEYILHAGDMLLIPCGVGHCVLHPDADHEFYSLKFEASAAPATPYFANSCKFNRWFISTLQECYTPEARYSMPIDPASRELVEGVLLLSMKKFLHKSTNHPCNEPTIFRKSRQIVLSSSTCINVNECAQKLDMNAAQLNYQFSKELKEYGLNQQEYSVKKIIDEALLYQIDRYLDFTDFSLNTIASQMKFNNVYTFSRYYKRLTGESPGNRRKKR